MSNSKLTRLLSPTTLGPLRLANSVVMSPMTRCRAQNALLAPTALHAAYYRQRSSAGLIITEGTQVSPRGQGYLGTPGIYSSEQEAGWREVVKAVHDAGGKIVAQLWHVGRVSHSDFMPEGKLPVAPSAIAFKGSVHTSTGKHDPPIPEALTAEGIAEVVAEFKHAAEVAKRAGFDGVEVHGANGYLIDQFLRTGANKRTDEFGGTVENRIRFPLLVMDAILSVWDADRVGVRISPTGTFNDMTDDDPLETFTAFAQGCADRKLGFIDLVGQLFDQPQPDERQAAIEAAIRNVFKGHIIANGSYTAITAEEKLAGPYADSVAFGRPFIGNPDLVERFAADAPLAESNMATWYGADGVGYTDYPTIASS